jgi:hypothetical protein
VADGEGGAGVHERLRRLLELQAHDRQVDQLAEKLAYLEAGSELAALASESDRAARWVEEKKSELQAARFEARRHEKEADGLAAERRALEARLYSGEVKNLKEMEQMEKKAQALRAEAGELEEKALAAMERAEALVAEIAAAEREAGAARERVAEFEKLAQAAISTGQEALAAARVRRDGLAAKVDPHLLETYEFLRAKKGGLAIVEVRGGACGACRVSLPVILANRIRRGEEACRCENCGRILCWTGA